MIEGNGSSINLYQIPAGVRFKLHHHAFAELGVLLAGHGSLLIQTEVRPLREGDSFYVPGGIPHGFVVPGDGPVVMLNVSVPQLPDVIGPPSAEVLRQAAQLVTADPDSAELRVRVYPGQRRRSSSALRTVASQSP